MKLFIWPWTEYLTTNYHPHGGLVIVADNVERAREMLTAQHDKEEDGDDREALRKCSAYVEEPKIVRECDGPELIEIFPDAGCC